MDTQSVWEVLSSIPVGTVVAWITVICAIIAAICTGAVKLYKVFEKYKRLKDENIEQKELLYEHEDILREIRESLSSIKGDLDDEKEMTMKRLRHSITKHCNDAIQAGEILNSELKSIEEMNTDYCNIYNGNSWVHILVEKAESLPIIYDVQDE